MKEITVQPKQAQPDKIVGKLTNIEEVETRFGPTILLTIESPEGQVWKLYRTASMAALDERYLGKRVALKYEGVENGRKKIRVFVEDDAEDPFADEVPF
ncbi:MAG: hypothetical protein QXZ36_03725 [Thermoproteota archaeon]